MARLYTELPDNVDGHRGERALVKLLEALPDDELHLWCSIDFIPGVNDVDLLVAHEKIGVFAVEVKAVPLEAVTFYELESFRIDGRSRERAPLRQAKRARDHLASYLQDNMQRAPFVVATACWPKISRAEWNTRWPGDVFRQQAEGMIFQDDLAGRKALLSRLAAIVASPGIGSAPRSHTEIDARVLDDLDGALRGRTSAKPPSKPTQTDHMRLRAIEEGIAEDQRKQFADGRRHEVVFRGPPGTGKTFRLLQAGLQAARRGEDVLFVCFNKVLASDLARLVELNGVSVSGIFDCFHTFALVREFCGDQPGRELASHDERAAEAVEHYTRKVRPGDGFYKTVLVDEAQDLPDWAFTLIRSLAVPEASFLIAYGSGQALYRPAEAPWLKRFIEQAKDRGQIKRLNRNFRNSSMEFLTAQCFYETALRRAAVARFLVDHGPKLGDDKQLQLAIDFDSAHGEPPNVRHIETPAADRLDDDHPFRAIELRAAMQPALEEEIRNALAAVQPTGSPSDVLVLVPSRKDPAADWARAALRRVSSVAGGISFIDYTPDENRETPAQPDQIRLCTFHSSRGIEARCVIVINFHAIASLPTEVDRSIQTLGYIVLSRATERTTIMLPAGVRTQEMEFLEHVIAGAWQVAGNAAPIHQTRSTGPFSRGDRVSHQQRGMGRVLFVDDSRLWIDFGSGMPHALDLHDESLEAI